MYAYIGTNTQEDHLILLGEFFAVCQENHTRLKLEKCEFMQETMQYVGFDIGYGWWTLAGCNHIARQAGTTHGGTLP